MKLKYFYASVYWSTQLKMELFEIVQRTSKILGISPNQLNQKHLLNGTVVLVVLCYGLSVISCSVFVFYKAQSFEEYTEFIPVFATFIVTILSYINIILVKEKFFAIIDECVDTITKSK